MANLPVDIWKKIISCNNNQARLRCIDEIINATSRRAKFARAMMHLWELDPYSIKIGNLMEYLRPPENVDAAKYAQNLKILEEAAQLFAEVRGKPVILVYGDLDCTRIPSHDELQDNIPSHLFLYLYKDAEDNTTECPWIFDHIDENRQGFKQFNPIYTKVKRTADAVFTRDFDEDVPGWME